jgi:hypothetical protein
MRDGEARSYRRPSLYDVLQVSPTATADVIHAAYRALAKLYHPDVNGAPDAARLIRQLNSAYHVLGDSERRARYDAECARPARTWGRRRALRARRPPLPPAPKGERAIYQVKPQPARTVAAARRPIGPLVVLSAATVILATAVTFLLWAAASADDRPPLAPVPRVSLSLPERCFSPASC